MPFVSHPPTRHLACRLGMLVVGLSLMALGVGFAIRAGLGTSPISSIPYVTSMIFPLSVGTATILMNTSFILIQILILRRRYDPYQLLQLPVAIGFGLLVDAAWYLVQDLPCQNYIQQWLLCLLGIALNALGVSLEVAAKLVTLSGEGVVLAVCQVTPLKFGNVKIGFDVALVAVTVLMSLLFLDGTIAGVREGTVAFAVGVGLLTKLTNRLVAAVQPRLLP